MGKQPHHKNPSSFPFDLCSPGTDDMSLPNRTIYQSNAITQSAQGLSLPEKRLIIIALSQIQRNDKLPDLIGREFVITSTQFSEYCDIKQNSACILLKEAAEKLYNRSINILYNSDMTSKKSSERFRYIENSADYRDGSISFRFSYSILPYICELQRHYTLYQLNDAFKLGSVHSLRLYELLKQFSVAGKCIYTIERLIQLLDCAENSSYKKSSSNFRIKVIEPSVKEINEKSDINVNIKISRGKRGAIEKFEFILENKLVEKKEKQKSHIKKEKSKKPLLIPDLFMNKHSRIIPEGLSYDQVRQSPPKKLVELWNAEEKWLQYIYH